MSSMPTWIERDFQCTPFAQIANEMKQWINTPSSVPQLWFGEHPVVVTKGVRAQQDVVEYWPSVATNRGGQLTMHLPGQLVFYPLWEVLQYTTIEQYRWIFEEIVMQSIAEISLGSINTYRVSESPGVFTERGKIASLGLRLYRKSVYHGISFNIACPLGPFQTFICCGNSSMSTTSIRALGSFATMAQVKALMKKYFYLLLAKETSRVAHHSSS